LAHHWNKEGDFAFWFEPDILWSWSGQFLAPTGKLDLPKAAEDTWVNCAEGRDGFVDVLYVRETEWRYVKILRRYTS